MSDGVIWSGLDEYVDELTALPRDMADESQTIMLGSASAAASEIRAAYPVRTGRLRDGVRVVNRSRDLKAQATVTNTSEYAGAFEHGTQARHNALGANRGAMPAGRVFIPIMLRRRRDAVRQVGAVLVSKGATVTTSG